METNNEMTAERSLEIIRKTIENNRRVVSENMGYSLILWGVLVVVFSLVIGHLWKHNGGPIWNCLWGLIWIPGLLGESCLKKKKQYVPENYMGRIVGYVWLTYGLFFTVFGVVLSLIGSGVIPVHVAAENHRLFLPVSSIYILCFGMATTTNGFILKNVVIIVCGFVAGLCGFVAGLIYNGAESMFVMAAVALIGLVMPGILTNIQSKRRV